MTRICKSCSSKNVVLFRVRNTLSYIVCKSCGHCEQFIGSYNLNEMFEDMQRRYFGLKSPIIYSNYSPFDAEILAKRTKIVSRYVAGKCCIVEVGPGAGMFLERLLIKGHRVTAIEHSPVLAKRLKQRSIPVIVGEFETTPIGADTADALCSFHVIEHVANPADHLAKAFEVVRSGGYAFVATPNSRSWEQLLLGRLSPHYDSAHLRLFSCLSLRRLCESVGWSVVDVQTPEYTSGWLRVVSKIVRRFRGEDEEETAGKYSGRNSLFFRVVAVCASTITSPVRQMQSMSGGGNELFLVLKKRKHKSFVDKN